MLTVNSVAEFKTSVELNQCISLSFDSTTDVLDEKLQPTRWFKSPSCRSVKVSACHNTSSRTYHHRLFDLLDYDLDYTKFLTDGDTIASFSAESGDKKLAAYAQDNILKVWVSADIQTKRVIIRIVSTYGVNKEFNLLVRVR